jgi:hypothetical protein
MLDFPVVKQGACQEQYVCASPFQTAFHEDAGIIGRDLLPYFGHLLPHMG